MNANKQKGDSTQKFGAFVPIIRLARRPDTRGLALIMALNGFGIETAKIVRDTYFLHVSEASLIPYIYIAFAIIMVIASSGYAAASRVVDVRKLARFSLVLSTLGTLFAWGAITAGMNSSLFAAALFVVVEIFFIFLPLTVWAIANQSFGLTEGEEILPALTSFALGGTVMGGLLSRVVAPTIGPYNLLLFTACAFAIASFRVERVIVCAGRPKSESGASGDSEEMRAPLLREPILRTLTFLAFPLWILAYIVEYTYFFALENVFTTPDDLAKFLATFLTVCSIAAFLLQVYVTPQLVKRFGVASTCFVYPAALAAAATAILVYGLYPENSLGAGELTIPILCVLFARFLDMSLYQSVYESSVQILYYAVSQEARVRARAFLGGIIFPLSIACAGALLALFRLWEEPVYNVTFTAVVVGFLVLIMAMDIRPDYVRSLLRNGGIRDNNTQGGADDELAHLSISEARMLLFDELHSDDPRRVDLAIARLIASSDDTLAIDVAELERPLPSDIRERLVPSGSDTL